MAYENPQAFSFESKQLVNTEQFESSCRLDIASDKPIKKVVSVNALPKIVSSEKVAESLNFSGRTFYQVVYETEEGALSSVVAYIEWQDKISDFAYDNFYLCPKIAENTVTGFSANELAISSLVNVEVYSVVSEKISSVVGLSDDYVTEEKSYECNRAVNTVSEVFNEVAEQEINLKVDEVLYTNSEVKLNHVTAGIDTITLEGEVFATVYTTANGAISAVNKTIDFKQEIAALSTMPNYLVEANVNLNELKVTATVSDIDQKTNLIYSIELSVNATIFSHETINVVEDTFSVNKVINANHECLVKTTFNGDGTYGETISGGFEADKDIEELLLITSASAEISDICQNEQGCTLCGAIDISAFGINENKENVKIEGQCLSQ